MKIQIIFYFFEFLTALSAILLLFTRNVFHGALLLIVCLLSVAGLYVIAFAEFIATVQILIYAGGILLLMIFGIMLTTKISGKPLVVTNQYIVPGIICGLFFIVVFIKLFSEFDFKAETTLHFDKPGINSVGIALMSDFAFPFEITGILLLITLAGAAIIASSFQPSKKNE